MQDTPLETEFRDIFDKFSRMYEPVMSVKQADFFKTTLQIREIILSHYGYDLDLYLINRELLARQFRTYVMPDSGEIVWLLASWDKAE